MESRRCTRCKHATPYRAELEGILGTLKTIKELPNFTINQTCDNKESVNQMNKTLTPNDMLSPKVDIILACQKLLNQMKASVILQWAKGQ